MVRGAQYDNGIPQSDNAIEAGETKAHGVNEGVGSEPVDRSYKAAEPPEDIADPNRKYWFSGQGSRGFPVSGSGKGHEGPRGLGEHKGLGAHKADGWTPAKEDIGKNQRELRRKE
ncbi:hypothetical protein VTN02DRAFT_1862 [Thermoascus thermophilus]